MNRRGFMAALAALAVAPKTLALPAFDPMFGIDRTFAPPAITGLQGWLPIATVVSSVYCAKDALYVLEAPAPAAGVAYFGVERGRPCIITHPSNADDLRLAIADALANMEREMYA